MKFWAAIGSLLTLLGSGMAIVWAFVSRANLKNENEDLHDEIETGKRMGEAGIDDVGSADDFLHKRIDKRNLQRD